MAAADFDYVAKTRAYACEHRIVWAALDECIMHVREAWAEYVDAQRLAEKLKALMAHLLPQTPSEEPWAQRLWAERERARKLYEDEEFGFIQMGHFHPPTHSRPPREHGPHWVVYGVYRGAVEIPRIAG